MSFLTPPSFGSFSRALPRPRVLPDPDAHFVPPFSVFPLADPEFLPGRQSRPSVLIHSSNHYPLGNCDSPRPETSLNYLTQLGAVSNRASSPSSLFAFTGSARTLPEELVNPASNSKYISTRLQRGMVNQPDPAFPRSPGRILETAASKLLLTGLRLSSFNELETSYQGMCPRLRFVMHRVVHFFIHEAT